MMSKESFKKKKRKEKRFKKAICGIKHGTEGHGRHYLLRPLVFSDSSCLPQPITDHKRARAERGSAGPSPWEGEVQGTGSGTHLEGVTLVLTRHGLETGESSAVF